MYESGNVPQIEVRHRLRIAREFVGLEQKQLAALIGVSRTTVSNAETSATKPRRILLNAWALACGVPVSWIETGIQRDPPDDGGGGRLLGSRLTESNRRPIHYKGTKCDRNRKLSAVADAA